MNSLKKALITKMYALPLIDGFENNSIIVMTAAGTYTGKPISKTDDSSELSFQFAKIVSQVVDSYREENHLEKDKPLDGNDGSLILKDVQLDANGKVISMPFVILFYDQITGITVGKAK